MVKNISQINNCNGLIVLVTYDAGQEFYSSHTGEVAYLPVYVETKDENLALIAVANKANKACQSIYVTFSLSSETKQEWKKRKYPGTIRKPGLDLPSSYQAYEIPDPGDCFCCASLEDYEVLTVEEFLKRIQSSPDDDPVIIANSIPELFKRIFQAQGQYYFDDANFEVVQFKYESLLWLED